MKKKTLNVTLRGMLSYTTIKARTRVTDVVRLIYWQSRTTKQSIERL